MVKILTPKAPPNLLVFMHLNINPIFSLSKLPNQPQIIPHFIHVPEI
jgi:hypothetical protein